MSIVISGVAKSYGDLQLFSDITTTIEAGQKVALTGRNGSGKSTLLRIIAGHEQPDSGSVTAQGSMALLEQGPGPGAGRIMDFVRPAKLAAAERALHRAQLSLGNPTEAVLQEYSASEEKYRALGGYGFASEAATVLDGLGLDADSDLANLSGGEQRRAMFARLLLSPAGILLLDEPTNHLDLSSLEWLESWLAASPATVLFVSHDRAFLDNVASRVLELERGQLEAWPGNYSQALELKELKQAADLRAYQSQARKKLRLETEMHSLASRARSADRFNHKRASGQPLILAKAKAENVSRTLAGRQKALEKRLERMDGLEKPFEDSLQITLPLPVVPTGPGDVLRAENLTVRRGGRELFGPVDLHLARGQRVALTGPNGSGKSSLLLALAGRLPFAGEVVHGHGLSTFAAWQQGQELAPLETVSAAVRAAQPRLRDQDIHHLLGRLDLPASLDFRIGDLSGGQRTKLALARLVVTRAHLLILDEPSNNLDLAAIEALEKLLVAYPGTVLFASHDRRLVDRVATGRWHLDSGKLTMQQN